MSKHWLIIYFDLRKTLNLQVKVNSGVAQLEDIAESIHQFFETSTAARERALSLARSLTRHSANAIRAIHRGENDLAEEHLREGRQIAESLQTSLISYLDIYYAGYTQDALKEFAEANLTYALITNGALPAPEDLAILPATYLQGLAEAAGELRRNCLDALLRGDYPEAERMLNHMDEIYSVLVTMDYPDAITGGLRRLTDVVRGVTERTRGDLTLSLRQQSLEQSLQRLERKLEGRD